MISAVLSALGLWYLALRLFPLRRNDPSQPDAKVDARVDAKPATTDFKSAEHTPQLVIVIPARNEAARLPDCLRSLMAALPFATVVVVDDESTDQTAACVQNFSGVHLLSVKDPRPEGWVGKNWACHVGACAYPLHPWILFTDADTKHQPELLQNLLRSPKFDLLTSVPFHLTLTVWEQLLGTFHVWIPLITNALGHPTRSRFYANGQFLLFRRHAYDAIGGHARIASSLTEDLALGSLMLENNFCLTVATSPVYQVRMFSTIQGFVKGWLRLFQVGMGQASLNVYFEIVCILSALTAVLSLGYRLAVGSGLGTSLNVNAGFNPSLSPTEYAVSCVVVSCGVSSLAFLMLWIASRRFGAFPWWSLLFAPLGVSIFVLLALTASVQRLKGTPIRWRGRDYPISSGTSR